MDTLVLHTTRGPMNPRTLEEASALHNAFVADGPQPGIEIARSLGDVSHSVYAAVGDTGGLSDAEAGELLFIDSWTEPASMEKFFADPFAQQAGDRLYAARVESEWQPAPGAVTLQFPAATGAPARFAVLVQAQARSAETTIAAVDRFVLENVAQARRRGQLSHQLFVRHPDELSERPASNTPRAGTAEVLALSFWPTLYGLVEHYLGSATAMRLTQATAEPPAISVWDQTDGFVEW